MYFFITFKKGVKLKNDLKNESLSVNVITCGLQVPLNSFTLDNMAEGNKCRVFIIIN